MDFVLPCEDTLKVKCHSFGLQDDFPSVRGSASLDGIGSILPEPENDGSAGLVMSSLLSSCSSQVLFSRDNHHLQV